MESTGLSRDFLSKELLEINFLTEESSNPELYSILYNKFYYLIDRIPFAISRKKPSNVVFRCRQNFNNEIFNKDTDISYPPKEFVINYGRANFPNESIFYGSIPSFSTNSANSPDAYHACILESDKELFTDEEIKFMRKYTLGQWDINEGKSIFVYLPFSNGAFLKNELIHNIAKLFYDFSHELYSKEDIEDVIIPFQKYIAHKFSAKKLHANNYILTNAFIKALFNYYNSIDGKLDGIIYSSAVTECSTVNVALLPKYVDSHLKLNKVMMMSCKGYEKQRSIDKLTDIVNVMDGKFNFIF